MPTPTSYFLSQATDFSASFNCAGDRFTREIQLSPIVTALDYISTNGDAVDVRFKDVLSDPDEFHLHYLATVHSGTHLPDAATPVLLYDPNDNNLETPLSASGGALLVRVTGTVESTAVFSGSIGAVSQGASGSDPWRVTGSVGLTGPVAVSNFPATQNVTGSNWTPTVTGSVGLSGPITGSVKITEVVQVTGALGLSGPITGTVGLSGPVAVSNFPAFPAVQVISGSNWVPTVTGSVRLSEPVTGTVGLSGPITGTVGLSGPITGSVGITGPLTGTFGLSGPITGSVKITEVAQVTGTIGITSAIDIGKARGVHATGNSSTATLAAYASFTGSWDDVNDYGAISVSVYSDVNSSTNGLRFQWSSDGVNLDAQSMTNLTGSKGRAFIHGPRARYFRMLYQNGASPQGAFRLGTEYHQNGLSALQRTLGEPISEDNFAQNVRAVLTGKNPDNNFVNIGVSAAGRLLVDAGGATVVGLVRTDLVNSGSAALNVNSAGAFFQYMPSSKNVEIQSITFIAEEPTISFGTTFFGATGLTNGLLLQVKANDVIYNLGNFKYTRDMMEFASPGGFDLYSATPDIARVTFSMPSGVTLKKSGSFANPDYIRVLVRDNISTLDFFKASIVGLESD